MKLLIYNEMVKAMTSCDKNYDGHFYVGVHSTGIYCLPSCKAKLPLIKNVVFYKNREEAIAAGLRGCKRCYSDRYPNILPDWLTPLISEMKENYNRKLDESELARITSVDISTIRRHFKEHVGITPLAFHRRLRLNHARELIKSGENYLTAAYDSGYESSSGFRDAFVREFGITPGGMNERLSNLL